MRLLSSSFILGRERPYFLVLLLKVRKCFLGSPWQTSYLSHWLERVPTGVARADQPSPPLKKGDGIPGFPWTNQDPLEAGSVPKTEWWPHNGRGMDFRGSTTLSATASYRRNQTWVQPLVRCVTLGKCLYPSEPLFLHF